MSQFKVLKLRDYSKYIETCAAWDFAHWGAIEVDSTYKDTVDYYTENIKYDNMPETLIGCLDNKIICMATLKETEHPDRTDLTPWVGDVYVQYFYRQQGFGQKISREIEKLAKNKYGFSTIYLQTRDPAFYKKDNWVEIGSVNDMSGFDPNGEILMKKNLHK